MWGFLDAFVAAALLQPVPPPQAPEAEPPGARLTADLWSLELSAQPEWSGDTGFAIELAAGRKVRAIDLKLTIDHELVTTVSAAYEW